MIRERPVQSFTYTAGTVQTLDLPRDAVYHILQLEVTGQAQAVQGATGTNVPFDDCFPFSLLKNIRLLRNGADVVFQGSGCLLAKEHYYLNETFPHARLYTISNSVETLLLSTGTGALGGKGVTVPANDEGIGLTQVQFAVATSASSTTNINFDFQVDLFLQMGPADLYYGTLVDARKLATYQLELTYANPSDVMLSTTPANTTNTITATGRVLSYDQDNLDTNIDFGTFKRSTLSFTNIPYSSSNFQILLPRGNYFHGIIIDTLAFKSGSTTTALHENAVFVSLVNRINSNFQLRNVNWEDLQRKNQADGCCNNAFTGSRGMPNGTAYFYYPCVGDKGNEMIPTHVMDQFDFQVTTASAATVVGPTNTGVNGPENGATTASTNPTINMLLEEVIPGVSIAGAPAGSTAGSIGRTSAKPYTA